MHPFQDRGGGNLIYWPISSVSVMTQISHPLRWMSMATLYGNFWTGWELCPAFAICKCWNYIEITFKFIRNICWCYIKHTFLVPSFIEIRKNRDMLLVQEANIWLILVCQAFFKEIIMNNCSKDLQIAISGIWQTGKAIYSRSHSWYALFLETCMYVF